MEIFSAANLGPRVRVKTVGKSLTKQSFFEESEINNIVARYNRTGIVDHLGKHGGEYGFASGLSFHEAMNVVTKADQMFHDLPANIRRRFDGDPAGFLDFVQNPENQEEMIKMGLAERRATEEPVGVVEVPLVASAPITPDEDVVRPEEAP